MTLIAPIRDARCLVGVPPNSHGGRVPKEACQLRVRLRVSRAPRPQRSSASDRRSKKLASNFSATARPAPAAALILREGRLARLAS